MRALVFLLAMSAFGQVTDPVSWSMAGATAAPGGKVLVKLTAKLGEGWHLYSPTTPKGGPIPTSIALADNPVIESYRLFQPKLSARPTPRSASTPKHSTGMLFLCLRPSSRRTRQLGLLN